MLKGIRGSTLSFANNNIYSENKVEKKITPYLEKVKRRLYIKHNVNIF